MSNRAPIISIGSITHDEEGNTVIGEGWVFDHRETNVPALDLMTDKAVKGILFSGYTIEELVAIAEQKNAL